MWVSCSIHLNFTMAHFTPEKSRGDGRSDEIRVECNRSGAIVRASHNNYVSPRARYRPASRAIVVTNSSMGSGLVKCS